MRFKVSKKIFVLLWKVEQSKIAGHYISWKLGCEWDNTGLSLPLREKWLSTPYKELKRGESKLVEVIIFHWHL